MTTNASTRRGGLGPLERVLRSLGGGLLALVGLSLAVGSGGLAVVLWLAVALLGLDFVVTGIRGHCPLYARLGRGRASGAA